MYEIGRAIWPNLRVGEGGETMAGHTDPRCDATGCCCESETLANQGDGKSEVADEESEAELTPGEEN